MSQSAESATDLVTVIATFLISYAVTLGVGVGGGGPVAIVVALAAATWRLNARKSGWLALGLDRHPRFLRMVGLTLAVMVLAMIAAGAGAALATKGLGWPAVSTAHYGELTGNLPRLLLLLAVAWTTAAVGEELLFRGFLLTRSEMLLGKTRLAIILAVVLQAVLFGLAHYKQGPTGVLSTGMIGLVFGAFYARYRALLPLIIAHGLTDTLGLLAVYSGGK